MGYHMRDLIYRQEAIDVVNKAVTKEVTLWAIKDLQTVQPWQWISCTDRLPEYGKEVLTVNKDGDYEINHIIDEDDGEWFLHGAIAWITLPPYREDSHD